MMKSIFGLVAVSTVLAFTASADSTFVTPQRKLDGSFWNLRPPTESPTSAPTSAPSSAPTVSTLAPTFDSTGATTPEVYECQETYLDSDNLNIALVVDLSFSTYNYTFEMGNSPPIGDVNEDGKANTILDAEIQAIFDLLQKIADSESLDNDNCEIGLISFHTYAEYHGQFAPLDGNGNPNEDLKTYIKTNLQSVKSMNEVAETNMGFTNFDDALDTAVNYFEFNATVDRQNLLVFLSDGEPNVRGDDDDESFCAEEVTWWLGDEHVQYNCSNAKDDLKNLIIDIDDKTLNEFCTFDDKNCTFKNPFQDCVRGPAHCFYTKAVMSYESEIAKLEDMGVERLAIGFGQDANVTNGSALWMIDNNPGKNQGVEALHAKNYEQLSFALSNLCILNTEAPTSSPTLTPTSEPTDAPSVNPTAGPTATPTKIPTGAPSQEPTGAPTSGPTAVPTHKPTGAPTVNPTSEPTVSASATPSLRGSSSPTIAPTTAPTEGSTDEPTAFPTHLETAAPTSDFEKNGDDDDDDDDTYLPPQCPQDIVLQHQVGDTDLPDDAIVIVSQDTTSVTVRLSQTYTEESTIGHLFYEYKEDDFNEKCYEKQDLEYEDNVEITIQCLHKNQVATLDLYIADDIENGVLSEGDNATIPKCCHADLNENDAVTKYFLSIKCVSACPESIE